MLKVILILIITAANGQPVLYTRDFTGPDADSNCSDFAKRALATYSITTEFEGVKVTHPGGAYSCTSVKG